MKLLTKLLFIPTLIIVSISSYSQTGKDTLVAFQYYKKADSLLKVRKIDESIVFFEKALPIYKKSKAWDKAANCYNRVAENFLRLYKAEKSFISSQKALYICDKYLHENHKERAYAYDYIGDYHQQKANYDMVLSYYIKALQIREKIFPVHHLEIGRSYKNIAIFYYYINKYEKALEYIKKVLDVYLKSLDPEHGWVADIYNIMGAIYLHLEKDDMALPFLEKFLAIKIKNQDQLGIAMGYLNVGNVYSKLNQFDKAFEYFIKAMHLYKNQDNINELRRVYSSIGHLFYKKNEYDMSLQYYKKTISLARKIYGDEHPMIADCYANIGALFAKNDSKKRLLYYDKALQIYIKTLGESNTKVASIYHNFGIRYRDKKEYENSLIYLNKALKIRQEILNRNNTDIGQSYLAIGIIYQKKGLQDKALGCFQKSLKVLNNSSTKKRLSLILNCHNGIAHSYYKQRKYKEALTVFNEAILLNFKEDRIDTTKNIFDPRKNIDFNEFFASYLGKAKILQKLDLDESIEIYENLDKLVNYCRQTYQSHEDKVILGIKAKEMYEDAIITHMLKFKIYADITDLEKARYYSEKSKSNTLKNLLSDHGAKKFAKLPKELIIIENALKSNRAFYQSRIALNQSKDSIDGEIVQEYEDKLFDVNRRQDSLTEVLEKEYPKYYQLKHDNKVISVSEIQEKLNTTTILEFFTADSITYAFTISKNKFTVKELQTPKLDEQIKAFKEAIISKDFKAYIEFGNSIYNILIKPIKEDLVGDELIIIPDGSLWHLNFDLLLTKEDATEILSELPYLLKDHAITYANSATLYFNPFKDKLQKEQQEGVLAFSFSDSTHVAKSKSISLARLRDVAEDLPGTRKEIRAIADIIDGQYYFGEDSDEANFKKNASNYKILHLALHGDVDNERPQNSKLYFTKSKDTIEDSYLYGHELFALNIPSELTVLSACNTGTGKIAKGEGIMSLGHAFQYAGTKSLLLSSWEVPDETTPELMKYFYTNLKEGMSKSKALQQAKLQYLEQADIYKAAPFYWGGFYLVGDNAPIDFGMNSLWYWVVGIIGVLILMLFIYKKRKI